MSGCLGTAWQRSQNQHLSIINAFERLPNSILLLLFSHLMLYRMVKKMKKYIFLRIINLLYFFSAPVPAREY